MTATTKLILGALATALLALLCHAIHGRTFVDGLAGKARAAFATEPQFSGLQIGFPANPLSRVAHVRGSTDAGVRSAVDAKLLAIPGVSSVVWDDGAAAPAATAEQVAACQQGFDAAIEGKTINFDSGSANIAAASSGLIGEVGKAAGTCAGTRIEVAGHTDLTGNPAANLTLSERRAQAVVDALVAGGAPRDRFVAKGYGVTKPLVPGKNWAANQKNRRIEFHVTSTGSGTGSGSDTAAPAAAAAKEG